jgi:hypothetical protein
MSVSTSFAQEIRLLSAFFGLDNALPLNAAGVCRQAPRRDGMPVIFSEVIDPTTLQAADFAVSTESGVVSTPLCATLSPAVDEGELRTVLLVGEFGSAEDNPPVRVEVVGDIFTSGNERENFVGATVDVTPLSAGPSLIFAESVPPEQWVLDRESGRQQGDGCPSEGTLQAVRVTWAGGVSDAEGEEAGEQERLLYRVTLLQPDGSEVEVTPFALADLGDSDNNHLLCLDVLGEPMSAYFPAGYLVDPNEDTLNPESLVLVHNYSTHSSTLSE